MNEIVISTSAFPIVNYGDFLVAQEPFVHIDRIADFNVLIYVTAGTIFVTEDGQDYEINAGELLILKAGVHHFGKYKIPAGTAWHYVHFYTADCPFLPVYDPYSDNETALSYNEKMLFMTVVPKKTAMLVGSRIEKEISQLTSSFSSQKPLRRWNANAQLFAILTECAFRDFEEKPYTLPLSERISEYLREHLFENFSANALEKHFYLSYKHMAAVFRKEKQTTMQQYHSELRINEACRLLRSSMLTVGEISAQLGFSDMLYFSRCFKKLTGVCPTQYRKNLPFRERES